MINQIKHPFSLYSQNERMALNTRVTLYIRTITPRSDHTMTFPGLQLGTIYNQIMQYCYVHFPEDEARNEDMSDMRETTYMGLTHVRNRIVDSSRPILAVSQTYSRERDTDTIYYMRAEENEGETTPSTQIPQELEYEDDNESVTVSIASSQAIEEQEVDLLQHASG